MSITTTGVFGQILFNPNIHSRYVADALSFNQETVKRALIVNNVTVQALMPLSAPTWHTNPSNTLAFFDGVAYFLSIGEVQPVTHDLGLTHEVTIKDRHWLEDDLGLSDSNYVAGPKYYNFRHKMGLKEVVVGCLGVDSREVEHTLSFSHWAGFGYEFSITDTLSFTDETLRIWPFYHVLNLSQTASGGKETRVEHILAFVSTLETDNLFTADVAHTNILQDAMTYYLDGRCREKQYNRFEGSGSGAGMSDQLFTFDAELVLESLSGTKETIRLRNPETDDRRRIGYTRVNRETRGGELMVFADSDWPQIQSLLYTIVALSDGTGSCPDKINDLIDFFQDHLGEEIYLHDWEGVTWRGVVTTPNEVATEDRDGWWTISFEFQGEPLEGPTGDQKLTFAQTLGLNAIWNRSLTSDLGLTDSAEDLSVGDQEYSVSSAISFTHAATGIHETYILEDDFSGGAGTDLDGQSPDIGSSTWAAHEEYKANGTQDNPINSGAYYPFVPVSGKTYHIEWEISSLTESDGDETRFFIGEGLPSDPDQIGGTANGNADPTTLKAGFVMRKSTTQQNACRLGDEYDGQADTVNFTDATLKTEDDDLDMRLVLDTTAGAGLWTVTWYAKDPVDSDWTEVRAETSLLSEDITMVGWSNNNLNTDVTLDDIRIVEKVAI